MIRKCRRIGLLRSLSWSSGMTALAWSALSWYIQMVACRKQAAFSGRTAVRGIMVIVQIRMNRNSIMWRKLTTFPVRQLWSENHCGKKSAALTSDLYRLTVRTAIWRSRFASMAVKSCISRNRLLFTLRVFLTVQTLRAAKRHFRWRIRKSSLKNGSGNFRKIICRMRLIRSAHVNVRYIRKFCWWLIITYRITIKTQAVERYTNISSCS